jgi:hypothetical protein
MTKTWYWASSKQIPFFNANRTATISKGSSSQIHIWVCENIKIIRWLERETSPRVDQSIPLFLSKIMGLMPKGMWKQHLSERVAVDPLVSKFFVFLSFLVNFFPL